MPGKIFMKLALSSYGRQVVSAGVMLTMAAMLLFGVINALEPAGELPDSKAAQSEDDGGREQHAAANRLTADFLQPVPAPPVNAAAGKARAGESSDAAGVQSISQLWDGEVTRNFGWYLHPLYKEWRYHNGVDISGGEGQIVPVLSDGKVAAIYTDKQYGLTAVVQGETYSIAYSSLASTAVQENTLVKTGQPIGSMGITSAEPEPHLHLAVQAKNRQNELDPGEIFPAIRQ